MREKSKLWDEMGTKPIQLKLRLAEAGRSMEWLAKEVAKKGYKISRVSVWGVINKDYKPKRFEDLKRIIEKVLMESSISIKHIWLPLPGAENKMWKINPHGSFVQRNRSERKISHRRYTINNGTAAGENKKEVEMNYTKAFLDDEVLRHFGLSDDPFFDIIDFTDIWLSPRHKILEKRVYDTIKRHGIMTLIGDIGAGKTTFLRYVTTKLIKEKSIKIIYPDRLDRKNLNGASLTHAVLTQLGATRVPRNGGDKDALAKRLLEENVKMGTNPVLILDEAHDLQEEAFIALKRLWDSGMIFKLLSIILIGQGGVNSYNTNYGLKRHLEENPWVREFAERCYVVELGSLNGSMSQYLKFRFEKAGGDVGKVFTDKALHILSKKADVPQLANNIAIRAMQNAYRDGKLQVQPEHVAEA